MNKFPLVILMTLAGLAGTANAQSASGITESTDPAKIAAVEQRARELGHMQSAPAAGKMMGDAKPMHKMDAGDKHHGAMHHDKMHHDKMHHGKKHHGKKHHSMMRGDKAETAMPMPMPMPTPPAKQ